MQSMKIYVLIEDKENEAEIRIDGNLETLRRLMNMMCAELAQPGLITKPLVQAKGTKQVNLHVAS